MIEPSRLCVGVNLAIPGVVEIDLGEALEELGLVVVGYGLNPMRGFGG